MFTSKSSRHRRACNLVRKGELSHARQALVSAALAPGNTTYGLLSDPAAGPPHLSEPMPDDALSFQPGTPVDLDPQLFVRMLRSARRGVSGGLSGLRNEHLKLLLSDADALQHLVSAAELFARARVPEQVCSVVALGRLTALCKMEIPQGYEAMLLVIHFRGWWRKR